MVMLQLQHHNYSKNTKPKFWIFWGELKFFGVNSVGGRMSILPLFGQLR
jgi:hypothetical protein